MLYWTADMIIHVQVQLAIKNMIRSITQYKRF